MNFRSSRAGLIRVPYANSTHIKIKFRISEENYLLELKIIFLRVLESSFKLLVSIKILV